MSGLGSCRTGNTSSKTAVAPGSPAECGRWDNGKGGGEHHFAAMGTLQPRPETGEGKGTRMEGAPAETRAGGDEGQGTAEGKGQGDAVDGRPGSFGELFDCPEQAVKAVQEGQTLIFFAADAVDGRNQPSAQDRESVLRWLSAAYPGAAVIEVKGDCQAAVRSGDAECLQRVRRRPPFQSLVLLLDGRHGEAKKSSLMALRTHIEKFADQFNLRVKEAYPLLFGPARAGDAAAAVASWRPEEKYLLDVEQGSSALEGALSLLLADQAAGAKTKVVFVGLGAGSEMIAETLRRPQATEGSSGQAGSDWSSVLLGRFPAAEAVMFNLPGWTVLARDSGSGGGPASPDDVGAEGPPPAGQPGTSEGLTLEGNAVLGKRYAPAGAVPAVILNRQTDLRTQTGNFFQYFALSRLFSERIRVDQTIPAWLLEGTGDGERFQQLRRGEVQEIRVPDQVLVHAGEIPLGGEPQTLTMPYRTDLHGAVDFEFSLRDELGDGRRLGLFRFGGCREGVFPAAGNGSEVNPRGWLESKGGRLQLQVALDYQGEEHRMTVPDQHLLAKLGDGGWHRLRFEWRLPTRSMLPEVIPITDLATFFDGSRGAGSKNLEILAWVIGARLPSSFGFQQGTGRMSLTVDGSKAAEADIEPADGARYFRSCMGYDDLAMAEAGGSPMAYENFAARVDWEFVQGSLCKSAAALSSFPVGVGCPLGAGLDPPEEAGAVRQVRLR